MGGNSPEAFPATPDSQWLRFIRPLVLYDPAQTIRQPRLPVLALFGELDNNVLAEKNRAAWQAALEAGGHYDYALHILPKANHALLEAKAGNNAEMKSLQRFVPAYYDIVLGWLPGFVTALAVAAKSRARAGRPPHAREAARGRSGTAPRQRGRAGRARSPRRAT